MGQYLGQNKHEKANRAVNQLILFTALFAICIMIGLYLARNLILHRVFGAIEANVMEASKTYLLIVSASIPFIALYNAGAAVFRTMGNSKVPMYLSMMMNAINVGGNAILIFGFDMGVAVRQPRRLFPVSFPLLQSFCCFALRSICCIWSVRFPLSWISVC